MQINISSAKGRSQRREFTDEIYTKSAFCSEGQNFYLSIMLHSVPQHPPTCPRNRRTVCPASWEIRENSGDRRASPATRLQKSSAHAAASRQGASIAGSGGTGAKFRAMSSPWLPGDHSIGNMCDLSIKLHELCIVILGMQMDWPVKRTRQAGAEVRGSVLALEQREEDHVADGRSSC